MLELLIGLGSKSALVSSLALLAGYGLPKLAASERVMVLRAGIAALMLLPLFALVMPALELAALPAQQAAAAAPIFPAGMADPVAPAPPGSPVEWIPWVYTAGAALLLLRLIAGLLTLRRWTRAAVPPLDARWTDTLAGAAQRLGRPVRLLVSHEVPGPLSWGIAPAWLLIGTATANRPEQAKAVIAHELAHVRRFDWPVLMAARIVTALYWFNPLVWLLVRTLARETELAADDDAVRHVAQADYAQTLLTVASPVVPAAACGMTVSRSMLAGRIRRVLETRQHRPVSRLLGGVLLIGAPAVTAPLAAMQLVPVATLAVVETGVQAGRQEPRQREVAPPVSTPAVAVVNQPPEAPLLRARPAAIEPRGTEALAGVDEPATLQTTEVRERGDRRPRSGPEMVERRATALRLSDSANEMRAEADRVEADIRKRGVSREEREGTLAGARAMRAEAQRRDDEARRLIFGP